MAVTAFLYPSCTSCQKAKGWLQARGVPYDTRHIRNQAPTRQELAAIAALHPQGAEGLLSRRSVRYRELGLEGRRFTDGELLDLLAAEPKLLRRPLISDGARLVVGWDARAMEESFAGGGG